MASCLRAAAASAAARRRLSGASRAPVVAVAPPLPYRFAGRVRKGAEDEFLVSKGDLIIPVKAGDVLDGTYRVVAVKADGIELVYLPLGTSERIAVSSVLDVGSARAAIAAPAVPPLTPVDGKPAQLRWEGPKQVRAGRAFDVALRVSTRAAAARGAAADCATRRACSRRSR